MNLGDFTLWLALLVTAWTCGFFAARWRHPAAVLSRRLEWTVFAGASLVALSWAALAGALLRGDRSVAFVASRLVIDVGPLYRLAAIASGFEGAVLSAAVLLALASIVVAGTRPRRSMANASGRVLGVLSAIVALLLVAVLTQRGTGQGADALATTRTIPAGLLYPAAAARPALFIGALALLVLAVSVLAASGERRPQPPWTDIVRRVLTGSWLLSSLALGAEQWERTIVVTTAAGTGGGLRNAGAVGLWLLLGGLVLWSRRGHGFLRGAEQQAARLTEWSARAMAAGAACVVIAFAAHALARRRAEVLAPGSLVEARDSFGRTWRIANQGVSRFDAGQRDIDELALDVVDPRGTHHLLSTAVEAYVGQDGQPAGAPVRVRGVWYGILQETLVALDSATAGDVAYTRVSFVPLASLWIPGLLLLVGGCGVGLLPSDASSIGEGPSTRFAP